MLKLLIPWLKISTSDFKISSTLRKTSMYSMPLLTTRCFFKIVFLKWLIFLNQREKLYLWCAILFIMSGYLRWLTPHLTAPVWQRIFLLRSSRTEWLVEARPSSGQLTPGFESIGFSFWGGGAAASVSRTPRDHWEPDRLREEFCCKVWQFSNWTSGSQRHEESEALSLRQRGTLPASP